MTGCTGAREEKIASLQAENEALKADISAEKIFHNTTEKLLHDTREKLARKEYKPYLDNDSQCPICKGSNLMYREYLCKCGHEWDE